MLSIITFGFVSIICTVSYFIFYKHKRLTTIQTGEQAHKILRSSEYNRSKPNKWLINTLSIVNPFTIDSEALLKGFRKEVVKTLGKWCNEKNYEELVLTIRSRIDHRLSTLATNNSIVCLSKLAKQVTLDAFLSGILNVNADEDLLTELPDLIIHLWKNRDDTAAHNRLQELLLNNKDEFIQSDFWQHLQTILSDHETIISETATNDFEEKISNPLNIIVPGWETMWRVVFYSLLELLRHPELLEELRLELNDHSKSYRKDSLLEYILRETLRLYPPTKNIYRTNLKTGQDICINVQHIHRDKGVWGSDALEFRPDRFKKEKLTAEQKQCYLPFSISCPAKDGFAYRFSGAIVAEILKRCPTFTIAEGCSSLPANQLLDMVRNSYSDLLINLRFYR